MFKDKNRQVATATYRLLLSLASLLTLLGYSTASATEYPEGFTETQIATGMTSVTRMDIAPDGRIFVLEQGGTIRLIKNGVLLSTPFMTVPVDSFGEHGLLGIAFDPNFTTNRFLYIYYTATTPAIHNRVSRITANGDTALAGSEVPIFDLDNLTGELGWHQGGNLRFGPDGKLYIAVGDDRNGANSQSKSNLFGKILRINKDGTIPADNPFFSTTTGNNRAIWALGLRNPYSFTFQAGTGKMHINDVGEETWEEINVGIAGSNYGWPDTEGFTSDPRFRSPILVYGHGYQDDTVGCAITAGAFYNPATQQFPPEYRGVYFYMDFCQGWIRKLDPATNTSEVFGRYTYFPVDLKVTDDGTMYYLQRGIDSNTDGAVFKIQFTGSLAPSITTQPSSVTVSVGQTATFNVSASGASTLTYQWQRNGANIPGATSSSYSVSNAQLSDNGATFRAIVSNSFGSATSDAATLTVTSNRAPTGTITAPAAGTQYRGGDTISYAGTGSDPEDGTLPPSAFTWQVDFHHDTHTHPFIPPTTGATSGSFTIPTNGETATNVWYRIYLTVRDSGGLIHTSFRDVTPITETITLATNPSGLQVKLDDQPRTAPITVSNVAGINRIIEAVSPQTVGGVTYEFVSWSDGGAAAHTINSGGTFTATYRVASSPPGAGDVVLYASEAPVRAGNYSVVADPTAAGGARIFNPDAGAAKLAAALAS
ncbi:MAG: PQQ-dependent sugar dehydrogenase, partial [Blastocatellia bacterium]